MSTPTDPLGRLKQWWHGAIHKWSDGHEQFLLRTVSLDLPPTQAVDDWLDKAKGALLLDGTLGVDCFVHDDFDKLQRGQPEVCLRFYASRRLKTQSESLLASCYIPHRDVPAVVAALTEAMRGCERLKSAHEAVRIAARVQAQKEGVR